ncbi:hypothetical protein FB451DRAFT_1413640 [Mycena latifolia]|nr:hypothetical protein FB451DRAFT_1413640 [Mycena latifolia]
MSSTDYLEPPSPKFWIAYFGVLRVEINTGVFNSLYASHNHIARHRALVALRAAPQISIQLFLTLRVWNAHHASFFKAQNTPERRPTAVVLPSSCNFLLRRACKSYSILRSPASESALTASPLLAATLPTCPSIFGGPADRRHGTRVRRRPSIPRAVNIRSIVWRPRGQGYDASKARYTCSTRPTCSNIRRTRAALRLDFSQSRERGYAARVARWRVPSIKRVATTVTAAAAPSTPPCRAMLTQLPQHRYAGLVSGAAVIMLSAPLGWALEFWEEIRNALSLGFSMVWGSQAGIYEHGFATIPMTSSNPPL